MKVKIMARTYNSMGIAQDYNKAFVMFGHIRIGEMHYYFAGNGHTVKTCTVDFVQHVKQLLPSGVHGKVILSGG